MPKKTTARGSAPRGDRIDAPEMNQRNRLDRIPMSKIRLNPGNPVPDLRQTVTRLKELWPLRGVVMKSLENLGLKRGDGAMCDGTSEADIVEVRIGALVMGEEPDTGRKIASLSGHPADLLLA